MASDDARWPPSSAQLKHRFWTDIYEGCKLFYLSGIKHGRYPKVEVANLGRFISVLNFRPLIWRNAHPSVLADRVEDGTPPELLQVRATTGLPDDLSDGPRWRFPMVSDRH